jgi:hypothetical protein
MDSIRRKNVLITWEIICFWWRFCPTRMSSCSQIPPLWARTERDELSLHVYHSSNIHFKIILPTMLSGIYRPVSVEIQPTFRRNIPPSSSDLKGTQCKNPARSRGASPISNREHGDVPQNILILIIAVVINWSLLLRVLVTIDEISIGE